MKRFADLDQYLAGDAAPGLVLTIAGHAYQVPPPSAEVGLWCERIATTAGQVRQATTDAEMASAADRVEQLPTLPGDATFPERVLGSAYAAMVADEVDHIRLRIAAMTAWLWIVSGDDAAERFWTSGGRPEALGPNRAARRASTTMGEAPSTPRPGSGSGTSHPSTSGRGRGRRSRGRRS